VGATFRLARLDQQPSCLSAGPASGQEAVGDDGNTPKELKSNPLPFRPLTTLFAPARVPQAAIPLCPIYQAITAPFILQPTDNIYSNNF